MPVCGSTAVVTARTRITWIEFRECWDLLHGRKCVIKIKGRIYLSCVRSAVLCRSETWCMRENERAVLRTKKAIIRAMCEVALSEKRSS